MEPCKTYEPFLSAAGILNVWKILLTKGFIFFCKLFKQ